MAKAKNKATVRWKNCGTWLKLVPSKPRKTPPWQGLSPAEAYRKGREDEKQDSLRREVEKIPLKCG